MKFPSRHLFKGKEAINLNFNKGTVNRDPLWSTLKEESPTVFMALRQGVSLGESQGVTLTVCWTIEESEHPLTSATFNYWCFVFFFFAVLLLKAIQHLDKWVCFVHVLCL